MRLFNHLLTIVLLMGLFSASAQNTSNHIMLKSGSILLEETTDFKLVYQTNEVTQGHVYRLVQFQELPSKQDHAQIKGHGIDLVEYLPYKAYVARIPISIRATVLEGLNIRSISPLPVAMKQLHRVVERPFPDWANDAGKIKVVIKVQKGLGVDYGINKLASEIRFTGRVDHANLIYASVDEEQIEVIAQLPFVRYVDLAPDPGEPEHDHGRSLHRTNMMDQDIGAGRKYDGTGVTVAVNDDGFVGPHIDFTGRTEQSDVAGDFIGDHGDMVAGILGGAGNLDPTMRGMATGAFIFIRQYNSSLPNSVTLHQNDQVMVFNSSYGNGCNAGYTSLTEQVDDEIFNNQSLIQVFSAGNSGGSDCGYGAGASFGNVTGGHKIGKNVIATANLDENDGLQNSSSRGPSEDGRLKPDIAAHGAGQMSTDPNNAYAAGGGTSAAAPGIAGVTAQMIHAYRDLNAGADPGSGLIKACLLNSADDLGNPGPDYSYGWGRVNGHKAVSTLEEDRYLYDSVDNGMLNTHTLSVPAGVEELRVMLYWMDDAGSPSSSIILVNDLDLTLEDPSLITYQPLVLDPTPNVAALSADAVPGRDSLNNMEQVRITTPAAGTYTINVNGFAVPVGNQKYFIVWEFIRDEITVTYPFGAEGFVPGEQEIIRWDAHGNTGTFAVEYSLDDGASWTFISSSVAGTERERVWTVPAGPTERALIRVSRGGVADTSDFNFVIAETPQNITLDWVCQDSLLLRWDPVPGAAEYEVSMLGARYMDSVGRTTADSMVVYGHNVNSEDWLSVKAVLPGGGEGRRAIAVQKIPGITNCPMQFGIEVTAIESPVRGTMFNCHDGTNVPVMVRVTNVGTNPVFDIPVSYTLNGGGAVSEVIIDTIQPGQDTVFTFSSTINIASNGLYQTLVWSELPLDGFSGDDTLNVSTIVSTGLTFTGVWMQDFESFTLCGTSNDCGATICNVGSGWKNESSAFTDDNDWRTDDDGTPSTGTGPGADHTLGTAAGKYLFTEASGGCNNMEALLVTPCMDLSGMGAPHLSFWYHMDGADMGELHVDVFNGTTYDEDLWVLSGDQGNTWQQASVNLAAYSGDLINIRFRGITGPDFQSDMALDDIGIETPFTVNEHENSNWKVWPNPADDQFVLDYNNFGTGTKVNLYDVMGKLIESQVISNVSGQIRFATEKLEQGIYLLSIEHENGRSDSDKIVVFHAK